MGKIYIASKARHGAKWQQLRAEGVNISSTWIDEYQVKNTDDHKDLWTRCINEARDCDALIIIQVNEWETLKGALIEAGAALANNKPVFAVGIIDQTFLYHPLVTICQSIDDALDLAKEVTNAD